MAPGLDASETRRLEVQASLPSTPSNPPLPKPCLTRGDGSAVLVRVLTLGDCKPETDNFRVRVGVAESSSGYQLRKRLNDDMHQNDLPALLSRRLRPV